MNVYVSLTSIYDRQELLLKTLKSIELQTRKPDKCYLYLSEEPYLLDKGFPNKKLNLDLQKFIDENLNLFEIHWVSNDGSYRKLLPLLRDKINENCLIITLDDDVEYNSTLIADYIDDWKIHRCCISYRGFTFRIGDTLKDIEYYVHDKLQPKYLYNFHTGIAGVLYQPVFFRNLSHIIFNRDLYTSLCRTGDDIWFNFMRIANNIECYVRNYPYSIMPHKINLYSLYHKFNEINDLNTIQIRNVVTKLINMDVLIDNSRHPLRKLLVFDSDVYWETRYKNNGTSGSGSYGMSAIFKGNYLNNFIKNKHITSIIDYGVGDGNQLKYINTHGIKYIGIDVSFTSISKCQQMYLNDVTKRFIEVKNHDFSIKSELVISADVIYHLIDNNIYSQYMNNLFSMAQKYVIIHAVDNDYDHTNHVCFRRFTRYIADKFPTWFLIDITQNTTWKGNAGKMCFYVYENMILA